MNDLTIGELKKIREAAADAAYAAAEAARYAAAEAAAAAALEDAAYAAYYTADAAYQDALNKREGV
jgi:hypothetical protein